MEDGQQLGGGGGRGAAALLAASGGIRGEGVQPQEAWGGFKGARGQRGVEVGLRLPAAIDLVQSLQQRPPMLRHAG